MTVIEVTARPVLLLGWDPEREASPTGVPGGVSFGTVAVNATVAVSGIAGSTTPGTPVVSDNLMYAYPDGVAGSAATGQPQVDASVAAAGVGSGLVVGQAQLNSTVASSGVAGSTTPGEPDVLFSYGATGIASTLAFGTPQLNTVISPTGIASTVAFGVPNPSVNVAPTGISASTGVVGTPSLVTIVRPSGTGSTLAFGTVEFIARIFVDPQDLSSTIEFGAAQVINRRRIFRTPRNTYQWRLFKEYEGISLLKENGVWSEVAHPDLERTKAAEIYLGGGRDHVLSNALLSELQAAGYPYIEEIVP